MNGNLHRVFDMTTPANLKAVAQVLRHIRMPSGARAIKKNLRIKDNDLRMITTGQQLYDAVLTKNWRVRPVQFGLPASGHTLAELIRAAASRPSSTDRPKAKAVVWLFSRIS